MDVSTERRSARALVLQGAGAAMAAAAWTAPLLLPLSVLQALLAIAPWIASLEAGQQDALIVPASDWAWRQRVQDASSPRSLSILLVAVIAVTVAWVIVLRRAGPFRAPIAPARGEPHSVHAWRLGAVLGGLASAALLHRGAHAVLHAADVSSSLRPTSPASILLLAVMQAGCLALIGAAVGAAAAAWREAPRQALRAGALGALAVLTAAGIAGQAAAIRSMDRAIHAERSLASVIDAPEGPAPVMIVALARGRAWPMAVADGVDGARFERAAADRALELLRDRAGRSTLARSAERYVIGERLLAMDPDGARLRAWECVELGGQPPVAQALMIALGSAAPSPATRVLADAIERSEAVHRGPRARLLLARAHARSGNAQRARALLAALTPDDREVIRRYVAGVPVVLTRLVQGSITGRVLVDGQPYRGRVGLVAARELFAIESLTGDGQVSWLLRLAATAETDADGRFEAGGLADGEYALVLRLAEPRLMASVPDLPPLLLDARTPAIHVGTLDLRLGGPAPRPETAR